MTDKSEKDAAAKIDETTAKEKTGIEGIKDQLSGMENLLKSQVDGKKEPDKEPEVNFSEINPEEMAKSFGEKEDALDFIKKFCEHASVSPEDIIDESGGRYITEEMVKSMADSDEEDSQVKFAILSAMKEGNDRMAQRDAVIMHTLINMSKSVAVLTGVVDEMQKSLKPEEKGEGDKGDDVKLPELDNAAKGPLSQSEMTKSVTVPEKPNVMRALKKAFPGNYNNIEEQKKFNEYASLVDKLGVESALETIKEDSKDDYDSIMYRLQQV